MSLDWTFTAESYLDQLPPAEYARVRHAAHQLATAWEMLDGTRLQRLAGDQHNLFSLRVGADLRIIAQRQGDAVTIVDVIRNSQIEGLRRAFRKPHIAAERGPSPHSPSTPTSSPRT